MENGFKKAVLSATLREPGHDNMCDNKLCVCALARPLSGAFAFILTPASLRRLMRARGKQEAA